MLFFLEAIIFFKNNRVFLKYLSEVRGFLRNPLVLEQKHSGNSESLPAIKTT